MSLSLLPNYTRNELKSLKEETDRKNHEQNVEKFVIEIRNAIISTARTTNNTSYFKSIVLPQDPEDVRYKIIMDAIVKLKEQFIDLSIEYKFQTDIRSGKVFNHGIYIDWS
jgi:hypothetical protein